MTAYLACELGIEVVAVKSVADAAEYMITATRVLSNWPYRTPVTELDCVYK